MKTSVLKAKIDAFNKADSKLTERLHNILVTILEHSKEHVDCSMLAYLLNNMDSARRKGAIVKWAREFAPITVIKDAENKGQVKAKFTKKSKNWTDETWNIEKAKTVKYSELNKVDTELEQVLLGIEGLKGRLQGFIKRSDKILEDETKVNTAEVIEMKAYLDKLKQVA